MNKRPQKKKASKEKRGKKEAAVPVEELSAAYESALTKFDALDAWFETGVYFLLYLGSLLASVYPTVQV